MPEFWDRYEDVDIALPRIPKDAQLHPTTEWLHIHHGIAQAPPDDDTIRQSRHAYYAMISHLDDYLGEVVAELKHLGLYDDTVIVFTSENGDILGGAKEMSDRHGSDQSTRFLGLMMQTSDSVKNEAIAEFYGPGVIEPWLEIRRGDYKYTWTRNAPDLLFNLAEDPDEQNDLSDDSAFAEIKARLRDRLLGRHDVEAMTQCAATEKETRVFLHDALSTNAGYHWDYQPFFDATRQYVRGVNKPATA